MRNVKCLDMHGSSVAEVLNEFNERREEFGVPDEDVISISTRTPNELHNIFAPDAPGGTRIATVVVTIFYWSDD